MPHPEDAYLVFLHDALLRIEAMKETADELKRRADILQSEMASLLAYLRWEANP